MTIIKSYESLTNSSKPQLGDYVICKEREKGLYYSNKENDKLVTFLENNVGQIVKKEDDVWDNNLDYWVKFENVPEELKKTKDIVKNIRAFYKDEIVKFSSNKEELEAYLDATKYNL